MLGLFCEKNMAIQTANLGTAPSGTGGDTFRNAALKYNENFSTLAHAASRLVGTQAGNVMEVGAFGMGLTSQNVIDFDKLPTQAASDAVQSGFYSDFSHIGEMIVVKGYGGGTKLVIGASSYQNLAPCYQLIANHQENRKDFKTAPIHVFRTTQNTAIDSNGFIKAASPIIKLFSNKIELNEEAKQQEIIFEKLATGDYLIKGTTGFALEGWYVETPKDANGNVLFSVIYDTLENDEISVKTYKKKFDLETASIVADLTQPIDITENRWIDIRLQALPPIEYEMPISKTPADFQPTGIAQAVSEMMNGTE